MEKEHIRLIWAASVWALGLMAALLLCFAPPAALSVYGEVTGVVQEPTAPPAAPTPSPKLIALTFDDGPRRSTTSALLDGLAERGVQATFFIIGKQLEGNEDLIARMDAEGHQLGIHTYDHVELTGLSSADFDAQVGRTRSRLSQLTGHADFVLRPPYGLIDAGVQSKAGAPIILWSIDPEDWKYKDARLEAEHIAANARDGAIILLHDIYPASVEAALAAVDALHAQGYLFCTVDQLFALRHIPLEDGKVYREAYP